MNRHVTPRSTLAATASGADLDVHGRYFADRARRFLVTGSSGLVGTALTAHLSAAGHQVTRLLRGPARSTDPRRASSESWDPGRGHLDPESVSGYDAVVHLAGAGIADGQWSPARKKLIRDSRVDGTHLLARSLAAAPIPPPVLVCASAVGFYGDRGDVEVDEASAVGSGFLAETAREWEEAARPAVGAGIRVVHLRIGIVLTPAGGALARILPPYRMGLGGPLGNGRQFWSWIALNDLLGVVMHSAATKELVGPVNAVSPEPVRNSEFSATLARVLRRPAVFRVPARVLQLLLGEMADEMLLGSTRVRPTRLIESGFDYDYPVLEDALRHLLSRTSEVAG